MPKYTEKTPFAEAHYLIGSGHRWLGKSKAVPSEKDFPDKRDLKIAKELYKRGWKEGKPSAEQTRKNTNLKEHQKPEWRQ